MSKFYFTYGTEGQPFSGGWTEVIADSREKAETAFRIYHPDKIPGLLNCSSVYSEDVMKATSMFLNGNLGSYCREIISLHQIIKGKEKFQYGKRNHCRKAAPHH